MDDLTAGRSVTLVVDMASVLGSRPDGWWRDRAAATAVLLNRLRSLIGRVVVLPDKQTIRLVRVIAVAEGAARTATAPAGVEVARVRRDGDTAIVELTRTPDTAHPYVVVTADRGLRARLTPGTIAAGPGWLNHLING